MKEHTGLGQGRAEREVLLRATYIKCHIPNMLEVGLLTKQQKRKPENLKSVKILPRAQRQRERQPKDFFLRHWLELLKLKS